MSSQKVGLFVGLSTLDLIYLASGPPQSNQKVVAHESAIAAGGPATNAAVTFAHLGNTAHLVTVMGCHPLTHLLRSDLANFAGVKSKKQVTILDLIPSQIQSPPVSSIVVTQTTGERAVVSLNTKGQTAQSEQIPSCILDMLTPHTTQIILIDGHQIPVSLAIAQQAVGIPLVLDGGSWKPGLDNILPYIHYAICSADFYPPGCQTLEAVISYLRHKMPQPAHIAITQGSQPIVYWDEGQGMLPVPIISPIDTLGAGDIFHGAFCHYILQGNFRYALEQAARVATTACQFFGTRAWLQA